MAAKASMLCHLPSSVISFPANPGLPQPFPVTLVSFLRHVGPAPAPWAPSLLASLSSEVPTAHPLPHSGLSWQPKRTSQQPVIREQPLHHRQQTQLSCSSLVQLLEILYISLPPPPTNISFGFCSYYNGNLIKTENLSHRIIQQQFSLETYGQLIPLGSYSPIVSPVPTTMAHKTH